MENDVCTDMKTNGDPDGTSDDEYDQPDPRIQVRLLLFLILLITDKYGLIDILV